MAFENGSNLQAVSVNNSVVFCVILLKSNDTEILNTYALCHSTKTNGWVLHALALLLTVCIKHSLLS